MRRFFWAPKTYAKTDGKENIYTFALKKFAFLNLGICARPILWYKLSYMQIDAY